MVKNILKGIQAYGGTFQLISKLGLWKYFGIPMLISFLTALLIGVTAWTLSDNIGGLIAKAWFWEWGAATFRSIGDILGAILVIVVGLVVYKHIVMALSAPFMSPVSEKIEAHITGITHTHRKSSNMAQLWRGIRINIRNLLMELLLTIPIFILGFIPIIGFLSSILLFLVQSYYAGFGNMDYTLERHFEVGESVKFVKQNRGVAVGNGIIFMLMLLIPVIGIILVLPLSVTAASTETVRILKETKKLNAPESISKIA